MGIFIAFAWIIVIVLTTALVAIACAVLFFVFLATREKDPLLNIPSSARFSRQGVTLLSNSLRYFIRALATTLLFCPTFIPYFPEFLENLGLIDFMFKGGVSWSVDHPTRVHLASVILVKGLLTGSANLIYIGGAPLFMTTAVAWSTAMTIKHLPPLAHVLIGALLYYFGAALHTAAMAEYYKTTMDPFIIAILLKTAAAAMLIAVLVQSIRYLRLTVNPPSEPKPLCPPIPPLPKHSL